LIPANARLERCPPPRHRSQSLAQSNQSKDALAAEKAALEKELAKLKAEKASIQGDQPKRGPFGLPFAFGGGQ